jgi:hypothetical protein
MIIPDIEYLQDVCLSKSQHELLLEKLEISLTTLKDTLELKNYWVLHNKKFYGKGLASQGSCSYVPDYRLTIKNLIAEVRLYKKLVDVNATIISWLELYT